MIYVEVPLWLVIVVGVSLTLNFVYFIWLFIYKIILQNA